MHHPSIKLLIPDLVHIVFIPILDVSFDEMMGYPYEHEDEMINEIGNSIMKIIY